jgi:NIMA (never in mitosis gene a)-related kinase
MKRADREEAIDEARVLAQLNHPHVIKHYDSFIDQDKNVLNIVMELASKGSLSQLIKENKVKGAQGLPEDLIWRYLIQSLLGLSHIHEKKIIHRDIKALNLFLDAQNNIKIGDLGIARALNDGSIFAHSKVGTP